MRVVELTRTVVVLSVVLTGRKLEVFRELEKMCKGWAYGPGVRATA